MAGRPFPGSTGYEPSYQDTMAADARKVKTNRVGKTTPIRTKSKVGESFHDDFSGQIDSDGDLDFTLFVYITRDQTWYDPNVDLAVTEIKHRPNVAFHIICFVAVGEHVFPTFRPPGFESVCGPTMYHLC